MKQQQLFIEKPFKWLQEIDLTALHPCCAEGEGAEILAATRISIREVFQEFLRQKKLSDDRISLVDGFFFLFNEPEFARWNSMSWWEQRKHVMAMKNHELYADRALTLLGRSCFAPYIGYSDAKVAESTDLRVKRAWMRKRLVLKECYWNTIDSISYAAYHQKKYRELFPALCVLLCIVTDANGAQKELVLGIDNGVGLQCRKKSRESLLYRSLYTIFKLPNFNCLI